MQGRTEAIVPALLGAIACALAETDYAWRGRLRGLLVTLACFAAAATIVQATLGNLVLLCRRHHRSVHEDGHHIRPAPDGTLEFVRPDGRARPDVPAPASIPPDPVSALAASNVGLRIDANTARPTWLGERLDLGWALSVLHPSAAPSERD